MQLFLCPGPPPPNKQNAGGLALLRFREEVLEVGAKVHLRCRFLFHARTIDFCSLAVGLHTSRLPAVLTKPYKVCQQVAATLSL